MNFHDVELLSAYLDGQLNAADAKRLETRLAADSALQNVFKDLKAARTLLRTLPARKAPRNFTLRAGMRRLSAPVPPAFPALRFASVFASLIFVATLAVNGLAPLATSRLAAAPAPVYGMGGGGPPAESATSAPAAPSPPLLAAAPTPAPLETAPAAAAVPDMQAQKNLPEIPRGQAAGRPIVPVVWQAVPAALAVILGLAAWYLRSSSSRRLRKQWLKK